MKSRVMPSPKSGKHLTAAQKETLKRWIAKGAEYQPQWSFIAPKRSPLPAVKNTAWVRNPIDQFILAGLEERVWPAPEADKRTLARRVSLDLTGLPPSPEDMETFVNDPSPNAYEKYVDKLLAMPQYGEHRRRFWLDLARYADTHGIHFDNYMEIWTYRDWVIKAGWVGGVGSDGVRDLFSNRVILCLIFGSERRAQSRGIRFQFALAFGAKLLAVGLSDEGIELPDTRPVGQLGEGSDALFQRSLRAHRAETSCKQHDHHRG